MLKAAAANFVVLSGPRGSVDRREVEKPWYYEIAHFFLSYLRPRVKMLRSIGLEEKSAICPISLQESATNSEHAAGVRVDAGT
jgi:hypothetical protein